MTKPGSAIIDTDAAAHTVSTLHLILLACFAILSTIGISFGIHALVLGHGETFNTTREVPWGLLIASYVFFASMSTGLCIVASLGQVFGIRVFQPIVERTIFLAIVTIAGGLMSISLELENPWRVPIYGVLSPHPESNIWWKSTIYSIYFVLLTLDLTMLHLGKRKAAARFGLVALIACLAANLNMKADMSVIGSREFWLENYMPLYFAIQATLLGCSATMFFNWAAIKLDKQPIDAGMQDALSMIAKISVILLILTAGFVGWKIYSGLFNMTENQDAMMLLLKGSYAGNFWIGEVILAVLAPLALITAARTKNVTDLAAAGLVCLVGTFVMIYDLVVVGQLIPVFHQYNIVDLPRYFSYTPSLHEDMIFIGAISFVITAFLIWEHFYKIRAMEAASLTQGTNAGVGD
ncbi:MAG: NrfD/PsrC family molybdoenzyme membrane anchor subunit [Dissulfurimicrobium sp.]|uniref:NrfD/PsrC family molybdoenzyme membrane anchor subunit n=1 Tax=Dissulfurimicrobium sp. TaxID=2022436 RepID=UPI003D0B1113